MPAPSRVELADLARWSFAGHYQGHTLKYARAARAIFRQTPPPKVPTEDEVAEAFGQWLDNDVDWQRYTKRKPHLSDLERDRMTQVFARHVVYKDFTYIST